MLARKLLFITILVSKKDNNMKTIKRIAQTDLTREEQENVVQLRVHDSADFQLPGGFTNLRKSGFYFRRPRFLF